jgi:dienelactone hydrolase
MILFFFLVFGYPFLSWAEKCPKVNFKKCPVGFICNDQVVFKGTKLKEKLSFLRKTEYEKPWELYSKKESNVSSLVRSFKIVKESFKKKMEALTAQIKKFSKSGGPSKEYTLKIFKNSEKTAFDSFLSYENKNKSKLIKTRLSRLKDLKKEIVVLNYDNHGGKLGKTIFYLYSSRTNSSKKGPVLLIMPPIYGVSPFDIGMALEYVALGFQVAILELGGIKFVNPTQPIKAVNKNLVRSLGDTHRMIQYLIKFEKADPKKFGIFGFSLGGLLASMVYTLNDDVKALALAMAGGNFPEIFTNSEQAMAKLFRVYRMKAEKLKTKKDYFAKIAESFQYDPLSFAHRRGAKNVFFVLSRGDSLVPSKNQWDLAQAFGASCEKGSVRWENDEHFIAILKDLLKRDKIRDFFISRLLGP